MKLPDFHQFEPLNRLKEQMGVARDQYGGAFPQSAGKPRALILLKSGRRLDHLDPEPDAWTDEDLAIGLSRTYRWGGYSAWELPLSVAQHRRLQAAVDQRYSLPPWTDETYARHKHSDRLAAASEAYHVVGWSREEMRASLEITLAPLDEDRLAQPPGMSPWQPWPPTVVKTLFLHRLRELTRRDRRR